MKKGIEVFIADDNAADVRIITRFFRSRHGDCHFTIAMDGEEALEYVRAENQFAGRVTPDIILLDLNMPKKTGVEVLVEIRRESKIGDVPVIIVSGSDNPNDKSECLALGANGFVTKPSDLNALQGLFNVIDTFLKT